VRYNEGCCILGNKRTVYHRNGVREGEYQPLLPDDAGVLRSEVFPGLWLDVPALIADKLANLLATLQSGLSSAEHTTFIAQLSAQLSQAKQ